MDWPRPTRPVLTDLKFQISGATVHLAIVGKKFDRRACEDIIAMLQAQRDALSQDE